MNIDEARRICSTYLSGAWKNAATDNFTMTEVCGGLTNKLFRCRLSLSSTDAEPTDILLRIFGELVQSSTEALLNNTVVTALLSERRLGPKLHAVFDGGRIEEFVLNSRPLRTKELADPVTSKKIAVSLVDMHVTEMPLAKTPLWIQAMLTQWMEELKGDRSADASRDLPCDIEEEMLWICRELLPKVSSPVVFCHNDLQEGNILLIDEAGTQRLQLIDFEYCSYNYRYASSVCYRTQLNYFPTRRGFDIANHFCEWSLDYTISDPPYFALEPSDFPSQAQQLHFIHTYLDEISKHRSIGDRCREEQAVLKEVEQFVPLSHFVWAVWGLYQARSSDIEFDYKEYAVQRLSAYKTTKERLLEKQL
ncbi:choline/ethanolamine kinase-like isoform X3 [Corticium candelabrum]|uniref:choline/ethanolamine kinase-like isoform X3 n=1 Tax=Corticium candelabrum TaxID=121492 RepID=UPI002E26C879|nr:choline/ethanolamine kinase-like isoform X3 [Corticium candelabrum]